jgi:hypothetical protein
MNFEAVSPSLLFTASTVIIGLCLVLIKPVYRKYQNAMLKLYSVERTNLRNELSNHRNKQLQNRAFAIYLLMGGWYLLGVCIASNLLALMGISGTMLGLHLGPFQEDNYNLSIWMVFIGSGVLDWAFILIGYIYLWEAVRFRHGKPSPLE